MMLVAVMALFIIAAIFGLIILTAVLKNQPTPKLMVLMHGTFAFIALLMMIAYTAAGHTATLLITSLVLLVIAALGGFTLLTFDMKDKSIPKTLALLHPFVAITGLVLLIVYIFLYILQ